MRTLLLIVAVFLSVGFPLHLGAEPAFLRGYEEHKAATGRIFSKGWARRDVDAVARGLPVALADVERRLQRRLAGEFASVLVPDGFELQRIVKELTGQSPAVDSTLGIALPGWKLLILREGLLPGTTSFPVTLVHEVAHLVIHGAGSGRIPRWFDEGAAMWLSGAALSAEDEGYLALLARLGALYPIESLAIAFPAGNDVTSVAYRQSFLLVSYLVQLHGEGVLSELLDLFDSGLDDGAALERRTGLSMEHLNAQFSRWVAARQSFLVVILSLANVWTFAAFLALLAIARHIYQQRARLRALEDSAPAPGAPGEGLSEPGTGERGEGEAPTSPGAAPSGAT